MCEQKTPHDSAESPAKKRIRGNAITRLCKASAKTVRENSEKFAQSLFEGALKGDVSCAKLLVTLIEKTPPPRQRKLRSMALELANSPQWTGPPPKTDDLDDDSFEFGGF